MIIIDSSVLIAHLRGDQTATSFLSQEGRRDVLVAPALVAWELWKGAETRKKNVGVRRLLDSLHLDPLTPAIADLAGGLHIEYRRRGLQRPAYDLLIASHAVFHECPLATLDRDYGYIDGLHLITVGQGG